MKIKLNFGILKGQYVKFILPQNLEIAGTVENVKYKNNEYRFKLNDFQIGIHPDKFYKCFLNRDDEGLVFLFKPYAETISGIIAFNMFDTYGFPFELTQEIIMEQNGLQVEKGSYDIMRQVQKEFSSGTYKNKDGWNNK